METNFDDIIESVLSKSAIWISGPYGSGKSHILNQLREFFIDRNYEVRSFYAESNETLVSFFNKITAPIININNNDQNFELHLNRLFKIISENQKNGFVIIIDELENWFISLLGMDHKQIDSIARFIRFLAEFTLKHKDVILIISSKDKIPIGRNFNSLNRIKDKIHEIWLG